MQGFIAIFFRLLNFAVACVIIRHYIKKYLLTMLQDRMAADQQAVIDSQAAYDALCQEQAALAASIEQDYQEAQALELKLNQWKVSYHQSCVTKKTLLATWAVQKEHFASQRLEAIERDQIMRTVIPEVLADAHEILHKDFADQKKGEQFLELLQEQLAKKVKAHE